MNGLVVWVLGRTEYGPHILDGDLMPSVKAGIASCTISHPGSSDKDLQPLSSSRHGLLALLSTGRRAQSSRGFKRRPHGEKENEQFIIEWEGSAYPSQATRHCSRSSRQNPWLDSDCIVLCSHIPLQHAANVSSRHLPRSPLNCRPNAGAKKASSGMAWGRRDTAPCCTRS
jgi:hypothetical protein